jgi:hypothetical protein
MNALGFDIHPSHIVHNDHFVSIAPITIRLQNPSCHHKSDHNQLKGTTT